LLILGRKEYPSICPLKIKSVFVKENREKKKNKLEIKGRLVRDDKIWMK